MIRFGFPVFVTTVLLAGQAHAIFLAQCTRLTNPSHGGQADHVDLGDGRVMWRDWWSLEGTATNIVIVDCDPGQMLAFRSAETNMHPTRTTFDRTDAALEIINLHESGARVFATFERIAADLNRIARDIAITTPIGESCACAALYPAFIGEKTAFVLPE